MHHKNGIMVMVYVPFSGTRPQAPLLIKVWGRIKPLRACKLRFREEKKKKTTGCWCLKQSSNPLVLAVNLRVNELPFSQTFLNTG